MITTIKKHSHALLFFLGGLFLMLVGPSLIPFSSAATVIQYDFGTQFIGWVANTNVTTTFSIPLKKAGDTATLRTITDKGNTISYILKKYAKDLSVTVGFGGNGFQVFNLNGSHFYIDISTNGAVTYTKALTIFGGNGDSFNVAVAAAKATAEAVTVKSASANTSISNIQKACIDTDGGRNYGVYGVTVAGNGSGADSCEINVVTGNYNGRIPVPNCQSIYESCYLRENYCLGGQRTYEDVPASFCSGGTAIFSGAKLAAGRTTIIPAPTPVTIACGDFTDSASCPHGSPQAACNRDGQMCTDNNVTTRMYHGAGGFNFVGIDIGVRSTADAIGSLKQPVDTATTPEFITYFASLFTRLFDAFTYNIGVLLVNVKGIDFTVRELQLQNQSLREEINLLEQNIVKIAPVGARLLETQLNKVRSDFDTAALSREKAYVIEFADILTRLEIEQPAEVKAYLNAAHGAAIGNTVR